MNLSAFIERHPPHSTRRPPANPDEHRLLGSSDGVRQIRTPPAIAEERHVPSRQGDVGCHLWVINEDGIPYILERAAIANSLQSGVVYHTNLTGGGPASSGGELWVDPGDDAKLYINGCSGRYGPETEEELDDAASVFMNLDFSVQSFGWDRDAGLPAKVFRR